MSIIDILNGRGRITMNPFVEWLLAVITGVAVAIIGLIIAACAASYYSIWLAGFVLFILFFGAISGLYFLSNRDER